LNVRESGEKKRKSIAEGIDQYMSQCIFLEVKRKGLGVDHPLQSNAEIKERVELYLLLFPALGLCGLIQGKFSLRVCVCIALGKTHPTLSAFVKYAPSLKLPVLGCNQQVLLTRKRLKNSDKLVKLLYGEKFETHSSSNNTVGSLVDRMKICFERGEEGLTKQIPAAYCADGAVTDK
jgi:hypothetical protein